MFLRKKKRCLHLYEVIFWMSLLVVGYKVSYLQQKYSPLIGGYFIQPSNKSHACDRGFSSESIKDTKIAAVPSAVTAIASSLSRAASAGQASAVPAAERGLSISQIVPRFVGLSSLITTIVVFCRAPRE